MSKRTEATPGTAFLAPLYLIDKDGEILATLSGSAAAIEDVVDSTGETVSATGELVDVGGSFNQAKLNANFATLAASINAVLAKVS